MTSRMSALAAEIGPNASNATAQPFKFQTNQPQVACVSLSGNAANPFDDASGHRFILVYSLGRVRLLQAFQGLSTMREFEKKSGARFTWVGEVAFRAWWGQLCDRASGSRSASWVDLIGVPFADRASESAYVAAPMML
ncbi:hypothetical protein CHLRE_17g712550v5 [Chlamydomonas reinhardtii]|uniref:Uncharacterized protein n=1 Tax=Chlamydomonas reinhardtii TaxID=3055 RepID=A0A2K3CPS0_CHLRE|nr:uncharacterized protein CHLRE_17g712550v5 [Chlamydomonas reinhardtii]PNW70263.1 hypothetical protein CHLRE_17g712550v5 [Chlamydomonas reinhardtii]